MGEETLVDDTGSRSAFIVRAIDIFYAVIGRSAVYLHIILI